MVGNKLYYQKQIENIINANPATIPIIRETFVSDGYGGKIPSTQTIELLVTFYNKSVRRENLTDFGMTYNQTTVSKLLAKGDANIKEGDTFTYGDYTYKVAFVNSYFDICKQIELEVI